MIKQILTFCLCLIWNSFVQAQDYPVVVQAESGTRGSDWEMVTSLGLTSVRPKTDLANSSYPGNASKVITYSVTFPKAGLYDLYVKVRVGPGAANDDSYYYAKGFGTKNPLSDNNEWVTCNGLSGKGYIVLEPPLVVDGAGSGGTEIWKWVNVSKYNGGETPVVFTVPENNLTQTFMIGSRENGLEIDKLAFGLSHKYYTVKSLEKIEAGLEVRPASIIPTGQPIAANKPKYIGQVYSSTETQTPYFANYWNQVAPGNAGKWGSVEKTRDVMDWTEMDKAVKLARDNGFPYRFHVLIWGRQQPAWIANLSASEQLEEIKEWFQAVAARYPDAEMVEVVNEPTHAPPTTGGTDYGNYKEALGGDGASGWDWVLNAFRLARQYFPPTAKLMLNDYNLENEAVTRAKFVQIVNLIKAENLLDAIGTQAHAFSTGGSAASLKTALDELTAPGIPLYVTEMDVDGINTVTGELDDQLQLDRYQRIFPVYWEHPMVKGITFHGWRVGQWRTNEGAFLMFSDNQERPALQWLRNYVKNYDPAIPPVKEVPVVLEAESGILGSDFARMEAAGVQYITAMTDAAGSSNPGNAQKVVTYSVKFPSMGSYELYVRVRVGSGVFNDDSYYYGRGFGVKNFITSADWARTNGLAGVGYTTPQDIVDGGGRAGSLVWKWINLSRYAGDGSQHTFNVAFPDSSYVFQMGSRENGLDVDKIAFGKAGFTYTVDELDHSGVTPAVQLEVASLTYDGESHAASGFAYGNGGESDRLTPELDFTYKDSTGNVLSGAPVSAGKYQVIASFAGNSNYLPAVDSALLTILPKALTIKAADRIKECATALDLGTTAFTAYGLVASDGINRVSLFSAGAPLEGKEGSYPIAVSDAQGAGLTNYRIIYEEGTLLVQDKTRPVPQVADLPQIQGDCSVIVATVPLATDGCAGTVIATTTDPLTYNQQGTFTISWIYDDGKGNIATQIQTVVVEDVIAPEVIDHPEVPVQCYREDGTYTIPDLNATDNCGSVSISYSITGATNRSGSRADASGSFIPGISTINWTIRDSNGNETTTRTTVTVNGPLTAGIADVYALNTNTDAPNTLYYGYGPSTLTLNAAASGGTAPYHYVWTGGAQTEALSVNTEGEYSVAVSDAYNCTATASLIIKTMDVRCGGNYSKVEVCHNGQEICIAQDAVEAHLDHGDRLGGCNELASLVRQQDRDEEVSFIQIYPNPFTKNLVVRSYQLHQGAAVAIFNAGGIRVFSGSLTATTQTVPVNGLPPGLYYVMVRNGAEVSTQKVIKQ